MNEIRLDRLEVEIRDIHREVGPLKARLDALESRVEHGFAEIDQDVAAIRADIQRVLDHLSDQENRIREFYAEKWVIVERTAVRVDAIADRIESAEPQRASLQASAAGGGLVAVVVALVEILRSVLLTGGG